QVAAEDVDGDAVAELQAELAALLGGEAHLRRAAVVGGPPRAVGERGALGRRRGVGDAAVAVQGPVRPGDLGGGAVVDPGDDAAEHRRGLNLGDAGRGAGDVEKARELVVLDVDEEEGRGAVGQVAGDQAAQVPV